MENKRELSFEGPPSIWSDLGVTTFFRKARRRLWLLLLIPIVWILLANLFFAVAPRAYSGSLEVMPVSIGRSTAGMSSSESGLGGSLLSGLFGESSNDPIFSAYMQSWTSAWFAKVLAGNQSIVRRLFPEQWDEGSQSWHEPTGIRHMIAAAVKSILGAGGTPWHAPDGNTVLTYLQDHVKTNSVRTNVIADITIEDKDAGLVHDLLIVGHKTIADALRQKFRQRSDDNIAYLAKKLGEVSVSDYREAIVRELEDQEKLRMLAYGNNDFAAQPLGILIESSPSQPRPITLILGALFLTLVAYVLTVLGADRMRLPERISRTRRIATKEQAGGQMPLAGHTE